MSGKLELGNSRRTAAAWGLIAAYVIVYSCASAFDLWTTLLALERPTASEANVFVTDEGAYNAARSLAVTVGGGAFLTAIFAIGALTAGTVSEHWLKNPRKALLTLRTLSLNPWSRKAADRSALHCLSLAIAFPLLRVLAGFNNLLINEGLVGPIGFAVRLVGSATTPALGFILVSGGLYVLLAIVMAPVAASLVRALR